MQNLTALRAGETGIVEKVTGGRSFVGRASAMGFTTNVEITMLQNFPRGPLLVFLRDSQIALGRGEAQKIMVRRG